MLFDVITVLLIFDVKSLKIEMSILLYADDILFCVPGCGASHGKDLQAAMYRLGIFGYFWGLRVSLSKTYAVVKRQGEEAPMPGGGGGLYGQAICEVLGDFVRKRLSGPGLRIIHFLNDAEG